MPEVPASEDESPAAFLLVKSVSASSNNASFPVCEVYLLLIAKISPVGPVIGCTPAISYAIRLGIALLTNEIRIGSQFATDEPVALVGAASDKKAWSSLEALSWFSKITDVTARL